MSLLAQRYNFHVYDSLVRTKKDPTMHNDSPRDEQIADCLFAAARDDLISATKVLSLGLDPNACDYDRRTALHIAAAEGHTRMMRMLLERGASPRLPDRWGCTAIDEAKKRGSIEHVLMLSKAADVQPAAV